MRTLRVFVFSIFIFTAACGNNMESIQPTATAVATLPTTETLTPEPIATHTPIPTTIPFQYTSCADPELIAQVDAEFLEKTGMDPYDAYKKTIDETLMDRSAAFDGNKFFSHWRMYEGYQLVALNKGNVASVVCVYDRSAFNGDGSQTSGSVVAWTDMKGNFHPLVEWSDRRDRPAGSNWVTFQPEREVFSSMKGLQSFLDKLDLGTVFYGSFHTLSGSDNVGEIESSSQYSPEHADYVKAYLRALGYTGKLTDEVVAEILSIGKLPSSVTAIVEKSVFE